MFQGTSTTQDIPQGDRGEQGDAQGTHSGPRKVVAGEVFAFLDDIHVICSPHRMLEVH